jgi:hypothetical protein
MRGTAYIALAFLLVTGCQTKPAVPVVPVDPTQTPEYREDETLASTMAKDAARLLKEGKGNAASDLVVKGEEVAARLLAVPKPTLSAMESASDLDTLYGDMLFSNRRYGWARIEYQKNLARWRHWQPQTEDSAKRLDQARKAIAECDKRLAE